ncbi:hypothetical protein FRC03_011043 [Tulasnella sp. 419]|nr:hypothetical protein FRC03_011043 [Tulasnella sp. 419]
MPIHSKHSFKLVLVSSVGPIRAPQACLLKCWEKRGKEGRERKNIPASDYIWSANKRHFFQYNGILLSLDTLSFSAFSPPHRHSSSAFMDDIKCVYSWIVIIQPSHNHSNHHSHHTFHRCLEIAIRFSHFNSKAQFNKKP